MHQKSHRITGFTHFTFGTEPEFSKVRAKRELSQLKKSFFPIETSPRKKVDLLFWLLEQGTCEDLPHLIKQILQFENFLGRENEFGTPQEVTYSARKWVSFWFVVRDFGLGIELYSTTATPEQIQNIQITSNNICSGKSYVALVNCPYRDYDFCRVAFNHSKEKISPPDISDADWDYILRAK